MSFERVLRRRQEIDLVARSLIGRPAVDEVHVMLPDSQSPEPAFIRAVSWLYCLYFEAGRVSFGFLRRVGEAYALLDRRAGDEHLETVRCLRTELHHNLGFEDSDLDTRTAAENWRRRACGTVLPELASHWGDCYRGIVGDAERFLAGLVGVVRRIEERGVEAEGDVEEWRRRLARSWSAAMFDPLIEDAKVRLAREALSNVTFRNRHIGEWRKRLEVLEDGFDFGFEATRLIEKTLLEEDGVLLPVTGRDVMAGLGIRSGPLVGELLEEARRYFEVRPCDRADVMEHLGKYWAGKGGRGSTKGG